MNKPLVNLHIVGVQKAGTTALAHFLSQHSQICVVEGKEAHVFDQPNFPEHNAHEFACNRYAKKLSQYANEPFICDATPLTVLNPQFLRRCYLYNPSAKFILLLRDPIERAVSHFHMSKSRGREHKNMLMAFMQERKRLSRVAEKDAWASGSVWRENSYLTRGLYKQQIKTLFSIVPQSQCLIISQEELLKNHDKTLAKTFEFIGVENMPIAHEKIFMSANTNKSITERAARLFAALYFICNKEYPYRY